MFLVNNLLCNSICMALSCDTFQSVAQKSERIADEETKCQHMADLAQSDLNEALPALEEAIKVLHTIYFHQCNLCFE